MPATAGVATTAAVTTAALIALGAWLGEQLNDPHTSPPVASEPVPVVTAEPLPGANDRRTEPPTQEQHRDDRR